MASQKIYAVEIRRVTRRFGGVTALDDVSLAVEEGEFFSLLGPSGCGKTTLLRIIAGLEACDAGGVWIGGAEAGGLPAHQRPVNTVFQSYALFPHLTVWENVAFGLRMKKVPAAEIKERVEKMLELAEISSLARRRPQEISGGQKQRVALARAIVNEPKVLLLDEPLAALDLKLRKQLQLELRGLQRRLRMTFVYVTHDQEEALALSDRIGVMRDGKLEQTGQARAVYERPRTRFASQFLGACSLLDGTIRGASPDGLRVETEAGCLRVEAAPVNRSRVTLAIRPENLQLLRAVPASAENCLRVRVDQIAYAGSETHYEVVAGTQRLRAEVMNSHKGPAEFVIGQEAWALLPAGALMVLDD